MAKVNDVVEVYKWKKPRYLGKIVSCYPVGSKQFYKVSVLTPIDEKYISWKYGSFATDSYHVDLVSSNNLRIICNGIKSNICDQCKYRFICFATW